MARKKRLTVAQAAEHLGISESALRSRIYRGTIKSIRKDGKLFVMVDTDASTDTTPTHHTDTSDTLVAELRNRIKYLEGQIQQLHTEIQQLHTIQAMMLEKTPQLTEGDTIDTDQEKNVTSGWLRSRIFRRK